MTPDDLIFGLVLAIAAGTTTALIIIARAELRAFLTRRRLP